MSCESDLVIIGGGPAGLSAAINGASEGLNVRILDGGAQLGGQARESAAIENYPGFPDGLTGEDLAARFIQQSIKFNTSLISNVTAQRLEIDYKAKRFIITNDDYSEYIGKSVILALGLSYRRLQADGLAPLMGRGAFYGRPLGLLMPTKKCQVAIIGGANSAGQAAVKLGSNPKVHVRMIIRKTLADQMSTYLIDRIKAMPNVEVCEHCEVTSVKGRDRLQEVIVKNTEAGKSQCFNVDNMFIFIGATPRTMWLKETLIEMDHANYLVTWNDVKTRGADKPPTMPYETSIPGIFAAGDVRSGSIKRIAAAIGEGAGALPMVHKYLGGLI